MQERWSELCETWRETMRSLKKQEINFASSHAKLLVLSSNPVISQEKLTKLETIVGELKELLEQPGKQN